MSWIKELDKLAHNQEVLVLSASGVQLAVYNRTNKVFALQNGGTIDPSREEVNWMDLIKQQN